MTCKTYPAAHFEPKKPTTFFTYLHRSRCGAPLYAGYTANMEERQLCHVMRSHWWKDVETVNTWVFDSKAKAQAHEKELIASHGPAFNRTKGYLAKSTNEPTRRMKTRKMAMA